MYALCKYSLILAGIMATTCPMQKLKQKKLWKEACKNTWEELQKKRDSVAHINKAPKCLIKKEPKKQKTARETVFKETYEIIQSLRKKHTSHVKEINRWFCKKLLKTTYSFIDSVECDCIYLLFAALMTKDGLQSVDLKKLNGFGNGLLKKMKYLSPLCVAGLTDDQLRYIYDRGLIGYLEKEQLIELSNDQRKILGLSPIEKKLTETQKYLNVNFNEAEEHDDSPMNSEVSYEWQGINFSTKL